MAKPFLVTWTLEEWPLAQRWADTVGFPQQNSGAVFYAFVSHKKKKSAISLFDAFDEPELSDEVTDKGFWIAQLGLSAAAYHGDVHARWKLDHQILGDAVLLQLGPHFSSKSSTIEFGFHASVDLQDAIASFEKDGFDVRRASALLEPEGKSRSIDARIDWLDDAAPMRAFLSGRGPAVEFDGYDGILDRPQHWTEVDRRILNALAERGTLSVTLMRRLSGNTSTVDEALLLQARLREWDLPTELSLAASGTYPPAHGCSATYAALSMTRDMDSLLAHLRECDSEEPAWVFGEVIALLAFFAPTNTLQEFFTSRIEALLSATPDLELTRECLDDPDTMLVLEELGIAP